MSEFSELVHIEKNRKVLVIRMPGGVSYVLCDQRQSPLTKITSTFNVNDSENQFGFEVDNLF